MKKTVKTQNQRFGSIENLEARLSLDADPAFLPVLGVDLVRPIPLFEQSREIAMGIEADVNGDGRLDLVLASTQPRISAHLAQADGGFVEVSGKVVIGDVSDLKVADVDGDGMLDIVYGTNRTFGTLKNLGTRDDGAWMGFGTPVTVAVNVTSLDVGELNGDGITDVVVGGSKAGAAGELWVYSGFGDGTFAPPIGYASTRGKHFVSVVDVNGDRKLDIVAANSESKEIETLLNDGEGVFDTRLETSLENSPHLIRIADLNLDGHPDAIVGFEQQEGINVVVHWGQEGGAFDTEVVRLETVGVPQDFAVGDLNGDEIPDLIVGHSGTFHHPINGNGPGGVTAFSGRAAGGFEHGIRFISPDVVGVSFTDMDSDNEPEVVALRRYDNDVLFAKPVVMGLVDEPKLAAESYVMDGPSYQASVVADFNGDGHLDVATVTRDADRSEITTSLGRADGSFEAIEQALVVGYWVQELFSLHVDNDGIADLGVVGFPNSTVSTTFRMGDQDQWESPVTTSSLGVGWYQQQVVDVNSDQIDDLIFIRFEGNSGLIRVATGTGNGKFSIGDKVNVTNPRQFQMADLNHDQIPDLVVVAENQWLAMLGTGTGTFDVVSKGVIDAYQLTLGDFNGDGDLDLAMGGFGSNIVSVLHGDGNGAFQPSAGVRFEGTPESLSALDVDGDGIDELFIGGYETLTVARGDVDGFSEATTHWLGSYASNVLLADINNDGRSDVVVGPGVNFIFSSPTTIVTILNQLPDGTLEAPRQWSVPLIDGQLKQLADLDGDGLVDFVLAHSHGFAVIRSTPNERTLGDFNGDTVLDDADIDLLSAAVAQTELTDAERVLFDVNGDGDVTQADREFWITQVAQTRTGDIDLDRRIDFGDFLLFRLHFGESSVGWGEGDFDGDGTAAFADFLLLAENFGLGLG